MKFETALSKTKRDRREISSPVSMGSLGRRARICTGSS